MHKRRWHSSQHPGAKVAVDFIIEVSDGLGLVLRGEVCGEQARLFIAQVDVELCRGKVFGHSSV
jgi:hypothetical protein